MNKNVVDLMLNHKKDRINKIIVVLNVDSVDNLTYNIQSL